MADSFVADAPAAPKDSFQPEPEGPGPLRRGLSTALDIASTPIRLGRQFMYGDVKPKEEIAQEARQLTKQTAPFALIPAGGSAFGAVAESVLPAAAKLAPVAGRVATAGGIKAAEQAEKGEPVMWPALLDATIAGLTEGAGATVGAGLKKVGAGQRAYEWATTAPTKALQLIEQRVRGQALNIPSLSPTPLSAKQAVKWLSTLEGPKYQQARGELVSELTRVDAQMAAKGPKPSAGQVFKSNTAAERFKPKTISTLAEGARKPLTDNEVRAALDALATTDVGGGMPAGAVPIMGAGDKVGDMTASILRRALGKVLP